MNFNDEWEESSNRASRRDSMRRNKDLRYCPGVYTVDGSFHDIWLKCWLETTPYKTFDELWASGNVKFLFERQPQGNR